MRLPDHLYRVMIEWNGNQGILTKVTYINIANNVASTERLEQFT